MANDRLRLSQDTQGALFPVKAIGRKVAFHEDLYHTLLRTSWAQFFGLATLLYVATNAVFAGLYMLQPHSIHDARSGSYSDAFFFSVQTMATIGYGGMAPATFYAHVLVTIEALFGTFFAALLTGILFAKFARPTARVLFSDKCVIGNRDGVPHLMFRMANWRHNQIVEARLTATLLVSETTSEGDTIRRPVELPLVRNVNRSFSLTWLAMHRIEASSHFFDDGALERLNAGTALLILSLSGIDETTSQPVHSRYSYSMNDIVRGGRFVDIIQILDDGRRQIDYAKFHQIELVPLPPDRPA